ncbi:MAG: hypothetical protein GY877_10830 [Hyphomicrobium sp.]|nr:hypothetical protein [Hyphomicrobium sp.]
MSGLDVATALLQEAAAAMARAGDSKDIARILEGIKIVDDDLQDSPCEPAQTESKDESSEEQRLVKYGVPWRIAAILARSSSTGDTRAIQQARRWKSPDRAFLTLMGPEGTGKSVAAGYIVQSGPPLVGGRRDCHWVPCDPWGHRPWPHLPVWIRAASIARSMDAIPEEVTHAQIVALDDLGDEPDSTHCRSRISELIAARDDLRARTVITTNLDASAMANRYGRRFVDRLSRHGHIIRCEGGSLRK